MGCPVGNVDMYVENCLFSFFHCGLNYQHHINNICVIILGNIVNEGGNGMEKVKSYKLGMRTFKTGLAVSIGMLIAQFLHLRSPVFVVMSAIMAMKASVSDSFILGKNRMISTLFGAVAGLISSYIFPQNAFFLGLGIIIVIYIHNVFNWKEAITLSAVIYAVVFMNVEASTLSYAFNRTLDTFIGISVAMLINYFIASPNRESIFLEVVNKIYHDSKKIVYKLVRGQTIDLEELKAIIYQSEEEYEALKQEIDMNFHKTDSEGNLNLIIHLLDDIYNNISTLSKIKQGPDLSLTNTNIELIEELYNLSVMKDFDDDFDDYDIVYNYHLEELLNHLLKIEELLSKENVK